MFKFKFGLIWTLFVTPIFVLCLVVPGEQRGGVDMDPFLFIFFVLFELIGLFLLFSGLKTVIKDRKTKKYGVPCYGIVRSIQTTGSYSNGNPEYKAFLQIVNPENFQIEEKEEIIGFNYNKFPVNSYINCKYYEGDINLESIIPENEIPGDIKNSLVPTEQPQAGPSLEVSTDGEYVTIDGVQYKREQ